MEQDNVNQVNNVPVKKTNPLIIICAVAITLIAVYLFLQPKQSVSNSTYNYFFNSSRISATNKTGPFLTYNQSKLLLQTNKSANVSYDEYYAPSKNISYPYYPTASSPNVFISSSWTLPFYYNMTGLWNVVSSGSSNQTGPHYYLEESVLGVNNGTNTKQNLNTSCSYAIRFEAEDINGETGYGIGNPKVISISNQTGTENGMNFTLTVFGIKNAPLGSSGSDVLTNQTLVCGIKGNKVVVVSTSVSSQYGNMTSVGSINQTALINYISSDLG